MERHRCDDGFRDRKSLSLRRMKDDEVSDCLKAVPLPELLPALLKVTMRND